MHLDNIVVVGAGPAGIVCALELARQGIQVTLIESGKRQLDRRVQGLADANILAPNRHAPMSLCTRRQFGGASVIWGGRCIPYDPIDFSQREYISDATWPISYDEIEPFFQSACNYFFCGESLFSTHQIDSLQQKTIIPGFIEGDVRASDLERWSLPTNFGREYYKVVKSNSNIKLLSGWTATKINCSDAGNSVTSIQCRDQDGRFLEVHAKAFVIACGGLETTRLLLASNDRHHAGLGNQGGKLGLYYMGHISGRFASVDFNTGPIITVFGFLRDQHKVYLRPRFTFSETCQRQNTLNNVSISLVNSTIGDPSHGTGVLSFAYLALSSPFGSLFASEALRQSAIKGAALSGKRDHIRNMLNHWFSTCCFIPSFAIRRYMLRRRIPGFFQFSAANEYTLHYHGEQVPTPESRVTLSKQTDELGLPKLNVDLRFSQQDVASIIKCHEVLDASLRSQSLGKLKYSNCNLEEKVWEQASDGYHQAGTTRMALSELDGVVDADCKVHGINNLFVASSSVFVTSSQANSTFTIVALAIRLAKHLASRKSIASDVALTIK